MCMRMHIHVLQLKLLNDVSSEWWEMKNSQGQKGMVPVNYVKKSTAVDLPTPSSSNSSVSGLDAVGCSLAVLFYAPCFRML